MAYSIDRMPERISIGRETETGVTDVMIDCGAWVRKWPGMALHAIHTPEGGAPYILQTETVGGVLVWHVTDADTAKPGTGRIEIVGEMDGRRKVSATVKVSVAARMSGTVGEPPEAAKPWADRVVEAAERITGMQVQAETLDAGSGATAAWDGVQGLLTIGVPKGKDGKDAVVDATLTQRGQAADAKATGDALALKLTEPASGLEVGKYFRIAAIDENGHAVLEAVDAPVGGLSTEPSLWPAWTADEQAAARERMCAKGLYRHIAKITVEEGAQVMEVSTDENGKSFSLSDVVIYTYSPVTNDISAKNGYFIFNEQESMFGPYVLKGGDTKPNYNTAWLSCCGTIPVMLFSYGVTSDIASNSYIMLSAGNKIDTSFKAANRICWQGNGTITPGTTFDIWGVDA